MKRLALRLCVQTVLETVECKSSLSREEIMAVLLNTQYFSQLGLFVESALTMRGSMSEKVCEKVSIERLFNSIRKWQR